MKGQEISVEVNTLEICIWFLPCFMSSCCRKFWQALLISTRASSTKRSFRGSEIAFFSKEVICY
jgi:hypothetical protein